MNKEDKEELLKEIDERLKQLRKEFIASLDDKKEFKLTYPRHNEILYCISNTNASAYDVYFDITDPGDIKAFEHGLHFKTEEEVEQHLKERKLLFKLQQWAKEKNGDWEPNWENFFQNKAYITCSRNLSGQTKILSEITCATNRFSKLPYFKSKEIAQECINLFGDEIKEVLC